MMSRPIASAIVAILLPAVVTPYLHAQAPIPVNPNAAKAGSRPVRSLTGAGASFVYPCMSKWTAVYHEKTKMQVNYQSIGSGGGIKQFSTGIVDFGATDGPMSEEELNAANGDALHIPVVMGAVAITYNLPSVQKTLSFSGVTIADIFLGRIKKWNDPAIAAENPGVPLPDADILVVHRSDGSGTTYIFSDFLSKVSPEWKQSLGAGKSLNWPAGVGGKGNEGIAAQVSRTPNAIGYVEVVYAIQNKMPVAAVGNREGLFVAPTVESVTAAVRDVKDIPEDLRMSVTDAPGKDAYPISGMTWVLAKSANGNKEKAKALNDFLTWVLSDEAQGMATTLSYSRLPPNLLEKARAKVVLIK